MQLNQVNIQYVIPEDRLLMRINTTDRSEFSFWLTRSIVARILSGLAETERLLVAPDEKRVADPSALRVLQEFRRDASIAEADFSSEYHAAATSYPLGNLPVLVTAFNVKQEREQAVITFELATRQVINMNFNAQLAVSVNKMLADVVRGIDWNLPVCQSPSIPQVPSPETEKLH